MSKAQIEMDRAMEKVEFMGAKRMRDVALALQVTQEYSRSTPQFKADCVDVVAMLRKWAAYLQEEGREALDRAGVGEMANLDVMGKQMHDPDDQMEYLGG